MHIDQLRDEFIRYNNEEMCLWMMNNKIFNSTVQCDDCKKPMKLRKNKRSIDGFEWRCIFHSCKKYNHSNSIRVGSFIENSKLPTLIILKVLIKWSMGMKEVDILKHVSISRTALRVITSKLNGKISEYFKKNSVKLGGPLSIVQVDETKLNFNVKSHRGRGNVKPKWCFCIVDCTISPSLGYCQIVDNRCSSTLLPIIEDIVIPGSTIMSDEWPSYKVLSENTKYTHMTVCHKYNFVCPNTGNHTQNVESYNNRLKLQIKAMKGLTNNGRHDFLLKFMWFERHSTFQDLIYLITT